MIIDTELMGRIDLDTLDDPEIMGSIIKNIAKKIVSRIKKKKKKGMKIKVGKNIVNISKKGIDVSQEEKESGKMPESGGGFNIAGINPVIFAIPAGLIAFKLFSKKGRKK